MLLIWTHQVLELIHWGAEAGMDMGSPMELYCIEREH